MTTIMLVAICTLARTKAKIAFLGNEDIEKWIGEHSAVYYGVPQANIKAFRSGATVYYADANDEVMYAVEYIKLSNPLTINDVVQK